MRDFQGKIAVITGAASGIGGALALRCAAEGMHVVAADPDGPGPGSGLSGPAYPFRNGERDSLC